MMKRTKKSVLAMMMSLALMVGLLTIASVSAAAEGTAAASVTVGTVTLTSTGAGDTAYAVMDAATGAVTAYSDKTAPEDHVIAFENGVLTLKNVNISGNISWTSGDVTIALSGTNAVKGCVVYLGEDSGSTLTIKDAEAGKTGYLTVYSEDDDHAGIEANTLLVESGNTTAYSSAADGIDSYSAYVSALHKSVGGVMNVTGGVLTAVSSVGDGVFASKGANISGGVVTMTGGVEEESDGLRSEGLISISGGRVTAVGGKSEDSSYGIQTENKGVSVSGDAELTAVGGTGAGSYGIYIWGSQDQISVADTCKVVAVGSGSASTDGSYGVGGGVLNYAGGLFVASGGYAVHSGAADEETLSGSALAGAAVSVEEGRDYSTSSYYVIGPKTGDTPVYKVLLAPQTISDAAYTLDNTIIINPLDEKAGTAALALQNASTAITLSGFNAVIGGQADAAVRCTNNGTFSMSGSGSLVAVGGYGMNPSAIFAGTAGQSSVSNVNVTAIGGASQGTNASNGMEGDFSLINANVVAIGGDNFEGAAGDSHGLDCLTGGVNSTLLAIGRTASGNSLGISNAMNTTSGAITAIGGKAGGISMGFASSGNDETKRMPGGSGAAIGETQAVDGDLSGNSTITCGAYTGHYAAWMQTKTDSGSSDDVVPVLVPTTATDSTVVVDGKAENVGKVESTANADGTKTTTVAVDSKALETKVNAADKGSNVTVSVPASAGTAKTQLVVKDVETMAAKDMSLGIKTGGILYTIPAGAIDTAAVAKSLGASDTAKVPVTISITPLKQGDVKVAAGTQITDPVKFEVTANYNGKTTEITLFDRYVSRVIAIPDGVDVGKITTGIRVEDGEHVPTFVFQGADGKYYAKLNSMTNSTYTVVNNQVGFTDIAGKWYEKAAIEMASREIISGKTSTTFAGESSVTRAEFASILARALGLPKSGSSSFSDVTSDDWSCGSVGAAVKYGIIQGYTDGSFKPNANITRQEAMAMIQRAAKVTGYAGTTGTLTGFSDAAQVASWAQSAVEFNVGSGLIQDNAGKLNPNASMTRAETAVVVLRLLQKSSLVDVRTNA